MAGDRQAVFCTRTDCEHTGKLAPIQPGLRDGEERLVWYRCEGDILIMDRWAKPGKMCGRYARRKPVAGEEV